MEDLIRANILKYIKADEEELDFFCSKLEHFPLRRKERMISAGEYCRHIAFVNKGCLRSFMQDSYGNEHVVQFAIEDYWISDLYSFLSGMPAAYTVEAIEASEMLRINRDALEMTYERFPKFERFFRLLIQKSYVAAQQRIISALSEDAEQKYLAFFEKSPLLVKRLPQQYIASYLGLTPESLSRIKKKLLKNS